MLLKKIHLHAYQRILVSWHKFLKKEARQPHQYSQARAIWWQQYKQNWLVMEEAWLLQRINLWTQLWSLVGTNLMKNCRTIAHGENWRNSKNYKNTRADNLKIRCRTRTIIKTTVATPYGWKIEKENQQWKNWKLQNQTDWRVMEDKWKMCNA